MKKFGLQKYFIRKEPEESGIRQEAALNLSQAKPAPKQLNLNKLSDGGGRKGWDAGAAKNRFLNQFVSKSSHFRDFNLTERQLGE
jgi:hypothetical protein